MTVALQSRGELPPTTAAGIAEVKALEAFNETMPPADVPVVECPTHGAQTVQVPWADGSSRFTLFFERLAIEVLLACPAA